MAAIAPGWNSVEAAAKWHRGFEIAGFVALGLLLLFEILSYVYGNRKDTLLRVEQKRSSDRQQQHDAQIEADREQERSDLKKKWMRRGRMPMKPGGLRTQRSNTSKRLNTGH